MTKRYEKIDDATYKEIVETNKTLVPLFQRQIQAQQAIVNAQAQYDAITAEITMIKDLGVKL